ncbi:hypothetical protein [Prochlorothrix hollandica]|uniref:hypothetical protein n=1 Tax=Prochlorothrix hollandica TaxID=1223 RepID=UPI00034B2B16|nr:hypothetical protein [Prochlorothrix hollandica]
MILDQPPEFHGDRTDTILNPSLILENYCNSLRKIYRPVGTGSGDRLPRSAPIPGLGNL